MDLDESAVRCFAFADKRADTELVAINDLFDPEALQYLLKYDTVMGHFPGTLSLEDDELVTVHGRTVLRKGTRIEAAVAANLGVDVVVQSTGGFTASSR